MLHLLYLTNVNNGDPEEDALVIKHLRKDCRVSVAHPLESFSFLSSVDAVVIRNIWPTHEYQSEWERIKGILKMSGLPVYNPLTGKGDSEGKRYLLDLYKAGYPVIPSVDSLEEVWRLGSPAHYWIKPTQGCDGYGSLKVGAEELPTRFLKEYIIQPFMEFQYEPSFYFINGTFAYAISMSHRLMDGSVTIYEPTVADLAFAQRFVTWNDLFYGLQRIDAVRTQDGKLLLTEIEDLCPYLYLFDMPERVRLSIIDRLVMSMIACAKSVS